MADDAGAAALQLDVRPFAYVYLPALLSELRAPTALAQRQRAEISTNPSREARSDVGRLPRASEASGRADRDGFRPRLPRPLDQLRRLQRRSGAGITGCRSSNYSRRAIRKNPRPLRCRARTLRSYGGRRRLLCRGTASCARPAKSSGDVSATRCPSA